MSAKKVESFHAIRGYACKSAAVSSTAKLISHADFNWESTNLAEAAEAVITAHTAAVVYTWDGSDPTATHGHVLPANGTITVQGNANIQALKFIRQSSDAIVSVTLEK